MLSSRSLMSGSAPVARAAFAPVAPSRGAMVILAAHKKGAGSTKNGRDSNSQRRGMKIYGGQPVKAGGIIFRQTGSTWHEGTNTGCGTDYTIYATVEGVVVYDKKKLRPSVHVYPFEDARAIAAIAITHTKDPKEGVPSRRDRRKSMYSPRNKEQALGVATVAAPVRP